MKVKILKSEEADAGEILRLQYTVYGRGGCLRVTARCVKVKYDWLLSGSGRFFVQRRFTLQRHQPAEMGTADSLVYLVRSADAFI